MVILTGDTHGEFDRIEDALEAYETTTDDVMIILGDVGLNYYLDERDDERKERLSRLPITLFCIYGNHEERPEEVPGYEEASWHGGIVLYQPAYPNILFAQDGEVYDFDGKKAVVIGGAYSPDKLSRLANGQRWFPTEQPDGAVKRRVERRLEQAGWKIDYVLSHTVPLHAVPYHAVQTDIDPRTVDSSTEEWLQKIEERLDYERWFAGHWHITEDIGRISILFEDYEELEG